MASSSARVYIPMPLTRGPELGGTEDTGGTEDAGVLENAGMLEDGGVAEDSCVPEDSGTEEDRPKEEDATPLVPFSEPPAVHSRMISPTKSRNSTPTVTIKRIARLSLW